MNKQVEKLAKTVDQAIEEALSDLGVGFDDVIIEVLDEGDAGGLLGFGRRPARVRVSLAEHYIEENAELFTADNLEEDGTLSCSDQAEDYEEDYAEDDEETLGQGHLGRESYSDADKEILEDKAAEFIATVLQNLGIHGRIASYFADDGSLHIDVSGEDLGNAIGRQGETLYALQYLTTLVINRDHTRYQRVVVDIDHYRDRRMRQLRQQARKSAERVLKTGRRYVMKPMNGAERRQVHLALADFQGIVTYSEGQEPKRSVVIDRDEEF